MSEKDFVYWLQGYMELSNPTMIGEKETQMTKVTPNIIPYNQGTTFTIPTIRPDTLTCDTRGAAGGTLTTPTIASGRTTECSKFDKFEGPTIGKDYKLC